jgi:cell division septation protein DedD
MEPALKQRMIGAIVLVALAVIFLPMLIKGPAPESGVADVPLDMPDAPEGEFETRELPLVTPGAAPNGGVVGMDPSGADSDRLPTVDAGGATASSQGEGMMPPPTAGGDYAVSFGSYANAGDAQRVVDALRKSQLPGYQETTSGNDNRTLYRVRIGPYASQADAEAARLRASHVRDDIGARVVALNADAAEPAAPASTAVTGTPEVSKPEPLPESRPAATKPKPTQPQPTPPKPVEKPVAATPPPAPTAPAAADVGFAVQLGAFSNAAEAGKLRDRARASGFSAFIESVNTDKGTLSRVRLGPVATRADAEQLKAQAAAKLGVSGIVRPHP